MERPLIENVRPAEHVGQRKGQERRWDKTARPGILGVVNHPHAAAQLLDEVNDAAPFVFPCISELRLRRARGDNMRLRWAGFRTRYHTGGKYSTAILKTQVSRGSCRNDTRCQAKSGVDVSRRRM
jgi:hypothetical protein